MECHAAIGAMDMVQGEQRRLDSRHAACNQLCMPLGGSWDEVDELVFPMSTALAHEIIHNHRVRAVVGQEDGRGFRSGPTSLSGGTSTEGVSRVEAHLGAYDDAIRVKHNTVTLLYLVNHLGSHAPDAAKFLHFPTGGGPWPRAPPRAWAPLSPGIKQGTTPST